jgi:hypothetical protein
MYQLRDVSPSQLTVLLLCEDTARMTGATQERVGVTAARLHWTRAGWRLLPAAERDLPALLATPDTEDAAAMGWKMMAAPM